MMTSKQAGDNRFIRFFKRAPVISAFLIVRLFPFSADAFDILLGTGETGTFSHFTGRTICRMINRQADDIDCKPVPSPGDVHNFTNLQGGSLDMALVDSRMLQDAMNKAGYFEFLDIGYENLRALFPLYDIPITLVARSDARITSLQALKGKRINLGPPRSLQQLAFEAIMQAKSWSKGDFSLVGELSASQSQDTMAFCHGTIQAMIHIGVHPDSSLQQLFKLCQAGLVNMNDSDIGKLIKDNPAFAKIDIAADTYPSQPKRITTFGTGMILIASENLDDQTVYQIMAAIDSHRKYLRGAHRALADFSVTAKKINVAGIQLHPGAAKYISAQVQ